jgi:hypothetical protein
VQDTLRPAVLKECTNVDRSWHDPLSLSRSFYAELLRKIHNSKVAEKAVKLNVCKKYASMDGN